MTHGTDRDTPTEGAADRDASAAPGRTAADDDRVDVPRPHDAPDGSPTPGAATADEPSADQPGADGPDDAAADREPAPVPDAAPRPVVTRVPSGTRPLAPPTAEPLAAWPSWDDVAVTAPPASDAEVAQAPTPEQDGPAASAPAPADRADEAAVRQEAPDGPAPAAPGDDDRGAPAPLPPLDLGGLSALAFTALNAASVGVPAHALPQSPLPTSEPDDGAGTSSAGTPSAEQADADPQDADSPDTDSPETDGQDVDGQDTDGRGADGRDADRQDADRAAARAPGEDTAAATAVAPGAAPSSPRADDTAVLAPAAAAVTSPVSPRADETAVLAPTAAAPAAEDVETRAAPVVAPASWPSTARGGDGPRPTPGGPVDRTPLAEREPSPLDQFEPEDGRSHWPRALAITGGAVALLAALYVGSSYALADQVPRGATVAGVEIGSMSSDEAEQALVDGLGDRATAAVPVAAQDVQADLDPAAAGLVLDAEATVARLTGVDLTQPVRLWRHVTGVGEQPPVTRVDEEALDDALTQLSGSLTLPPVDGTVVFADGAAFATDAVDGWELDTEGAVAVLAEGWLTAPRPVELPTSAVAPAVSQDEADRALAELAQPLASAPVTVQVGERQAVLDVPTLTAGAAVVPVEGTLTLQLDGAALSEAVLGQVPDLLTTASDARFEFQGGAPVIVPGTPGTTLDPAALATSVAQAATTGTDRVAPVELVQSDPAQTTAALEALGVTEVVSEFSTPLTSEPRRTSNIATGLANITGTLVRPGETFSLTEALGPIDAAHGFVQAGAIVNGEHKDAWGGGLSQVSTTTYNAAYFAGFEDVEHTPHSEWFQRYPEGREATIFTGVIDMKWKNNTPYGALVQGYVADGAAHVRIWSTKHFTVETTKSGRSGVQAPTTVYSQSPTCEAQSMGNPGFTVTNTRRVYLAGELVDTESHTWKYKPQNRVICGTAPAPGTPAAP
ncbi:VanW family protein [Cellulomonas phragmiteti]|uniref:YoaR-like putative peptidoglycan binding domain-containing protein n=1 Tax=Cellulomonas phragmiteti TaxID=478780 RepID=A0ABQ4DM23_9CELL|nr:VanW family protein [Cellulomonas phragmiteti]GIG40396.1 hypothetical protein Cph01nite_21580 [Cellulomonas phragmiteti]